MDRRDKSGELLLKNLLKKGVHVKILNGPFANFIPTIETLDVNKRISILMDLIGRQTIFNYQIEDCFI